ncbi:MAG: UDP-N-acetylglucosamine 2-epimerase [Myxococcales bacterium]|nr:UDP-N-acetylglucosamine 2-epimerase [Myxococcales bacterium]
MSSSPKRILFLTGTRADFGKLMPLMHAVRNHPDFGCEIFVTGMHTLKVYGHTVNEVYKAGFKDEVHVYMNQHLDDPMEMVLANTIQGLSRYIHENRPDLVVVHGDRVEALAGAIAGTFSHTLVCHIEGGERSGTVDEAIRHAVSKLAHLHLVANDEARTRLLQMGELEESISVIGSPDIDVMMSDSLPTIDESLARYEIPFNDYALVLFHPVTTEVAQMREHAELFVGALLDSQRDYVVIYPNNDEGASHIFHAYERLEGNLRFRIFPSIGFEHFLTLLKHARFIVGNSSAGVREAPVYGVRTINVGRRQNNRFGGASVVNTSHETADVLEAIRSVAAMDGLAERSLHFGRGDSVARFVEVIEAPEFWETSRQKSFRDMTIAPAR